MGVSRQPVRDAFYRLSQLGFLPSGRSARRRSARSPRGAVPRRASSAPRSRSRRCGVAAERLTAADLAALDALSRSRRRRSRRATREHFHALDDEFHRRICTLAGHEFAWALIRENKAHMDRVRYLASRSGPRGAGRPPRDLRGPGGGRPPRPGRVMRGHLGRIEDIIARIQNGARRVSGQGRFNPEPFCDPHALLMRAVRSSQSSATRWRPPGGCDASMTDIGSAVFRPRASGVDLASDQGRATRRKAFILIQ